jgi:hypothetical protein
MKSMPPHRTQSQSFPGRPLGAPRGPTAGQQLTKRLSVTPGEGFVPLPAPTGPPPFRRRLADVLDVRRSAAIERDGVVRFHCVGDTGGWRDDEPQSDVVAAMTAELEGPAPVDFFYHLGDVVYPHGETAHYASQFFAAYASYTAPIFAVPGNHDGEVSRFTRAEALEPFVKTFCSPALPLHEASTGPRPIVAQPNVYWTLVHKWLWIIGLYTNVPEGGQLAVDQLRWVIGELRAAPAEATVILAMHQPVFSADVVHGSNLVLGELLDACWHRAGRVPDAVFTGHAHNYQRFSRRHAGRSIPYIVAGGGGFHERHGLGAGLPALPATFPELPGVVLEAHECAAHGFMTVSAGRDGADVVYTAVSDGAAGVADRFRVVPRRLT